MGLVDLGSDCIVIFPFFIGELLKRPEQVNVFFDVDLYVVLVSGKGKNSFVLEFFCNLDVLVVEVYALVWPILFAKQYSLGRGKVFSCLDAWGGGSFDLSQV